jgi:hypothetical protein
MNIEITDHEHRPTAEFRDYMDWEIQRAFGRDRLYRRLRLAAVIVASLTVGVTAGLAPAQVRQDSARDSLLLAADADLRLAQLRLDLARAQHDKERQMIAVGALNSAAKTEMQVRDIQAEVARIQTDMAEIKATGQSPRNELNAPAVKGEDFVSRRVDLQLMAAEARLRAAEQEITEAGRRMNVGMITKVHELEARVDMMRARRDFAVLAEKRALRREFLEKQTPVDQLAQRLERAELQQDIGLAQTEVELAHQRLSALQKSLAAGAIGELEVMRANLELRELELGMRRMSMRLRAMQTIPPVRPIPPGEDTLEGRIP